MLASAVAQRGYTRYSIRHCFLIKCYDLSMTGGRSIHGSRRAAEAWRIAAQVAFLDPDVVVDPYSDPVERECLVLHKPCDEAAAVVLGTRSGIRVSGPRSSSLRLWPSVFAHSTNSVVAETVDTAAWVQEANSITTSAAAAAYLAIAAAFDLAGPAIKNLSVTNRWSVDGKSGRVRVHPLHPFGSCLAIAKDEETMALVQANTIRPTRWWLLSSFGTVRAVVDDVSGTLHTADGPVTLLQGEGTDGRNAILAMTMRALTAAA